MIKKDKKLKALLFKSKEQQIVQKTMARQVSNLVQQSSKVTVDVDDNERPLLKYSQEELKDNVPIINSQNMFSLNLPNGPYKLSVNPVNLYLAGRRGHLSVLNWRTKEVECEFDVKEKVRDIQWIAQDNFAVAQENYIYIYDLKGIEIHKIKDHKRPMYLEYLPLHFMLASVSVHGKLLYQDITRGQLVNTYQTVPSPTCLTLNRENGILALGDSLGVARMYCPNQGQPVLSMLCQKSSLNSLCFTNDGKYMVSGGGEGTVKVWDLRTCKQMSELTMPQQIGLVSVSQKGVVAVTCGTQISFYKNLITQQSFTPYMRHKCNSIVGGMEFIDFEDYLSVTDQGSYQQLLVPESGNPNLDTYEAWHFQTPKQRMESHVRALIEKLPPSTITLDPQLIGTIDRGSKQVVQAEKLKLKQVQDEKKIKNKKKKMRGRNSSKKRFLEKDNQKTLEQQVKWQEAMSESLRIKKAEKLKKKHELAMLKQLEDFSAFDFIKHTTRQEKVAKNKQKQEIEAQQ